MRFADKIMKLRDEQGISQKQLAKHMGVSRQTVYKWEADLSVPEIDKIKAIAEYFGVSCDELLNDSVQLTENTVKNIQICESNELKNLTVESDNLSIITVKANKRKKLSVISTISIVIALCSVIACAIIVPLLNSMCEYHTLEYTEIIIPSTCQEAGKGIASCKKCIYREKVSLSIKQHVYVEYECVRCGDVQESENLLYEIDTSSKTAYVKSIGSCKDTKIIISDTYQGYPVTAIGENAFANSKIEYVKIPTSVTEIREKAFCNCPMLTEISFSEGLISIEENSFACCGNIDSLILPNSLKTIGQCAFEKTKINCVIAGKSLTKIEKNAFKDSRIINFEFLISGNWIISDNINEQKSIRFYAYTNNSQTINDHCAFEFVRA
ncbi:MAG: leucine-rich repeat protein [Clostridia bacterium]|nr:leucine-rich repeat protein [Clostridia bacterium]